MAKSNDKRAERMARSNRNVNRAITVLMAGVIAEFYLLMVNNYYVKGGFRMDWIFYSLQLLHEAEARQLKKLEVKSDRRHRRWRQRVRREKQVGIQLKMYEVRYSYQVFSCLL